MKLPPQTHDVSLDIAWEVDAIDTGDKRLNRRAAKLIEALARDPKGSINGAMEGWTDTQAAYRFFDNDRVQPTTILQAHRDATLERIRNQKVVLMVHDSTELDFTNHPPEGAGPLNFPNQRGFLDHTSLALTPEQVCLGVLDAKIIARSDKDFGNSKRRESQPLETKESVRWLESFCKACELQEETPDTQIVSVADSEGDLYEVYVERQQRPQPAEFVIRAGKNRSLPELDPDAPGKTYRKLRDEIQQAPVVALREVHLPRTPKRQARTAKLEIRSQTIRVKPPHRKRHLPALDLNVVLAQEIDPPDDGTEVEWLLLTSLPIASVEEVLRVIDYYAARWTIEVFFRVLKTGCRVEQIQLETTDRLLPCLMLYKIIAWRIQYVTMLGRECPEMPCDVLFADHEWKSVWSIVSDKPLPPLPPRLACFLALLAELGGHNGRRHDGPPGPQAFWVGIRRMTDFGTAWLTFGPREH